ncbi:MAG: hypothetical protein ACI93T_003271, partial [Porticoccaceae bacterium]
WARFRVSRKGAKTQRVKDGKIGLTTSRDSMSGCGFGSLPENEKRRN